MHTTTSVNRMDDTALQLVRGGDVAAHLAPGFLAGPWRVEHELGCGGMGVVYAAVHVRIGKRAALKVLHQFPGRGDLLLEAQVVNQVCHPNIIDIFETGALDDGRPYLVMEELHGLSLHVRAGGARLAPDRVVAILRQLASALTAAHRAGIVHRDLKLDNVFLIDEAAGPRVPLVKLLDWGIAKVLRVGPEGPRDGICIGTPQYLSPEQACGAPVSGKTDVYSLGVMAYELFLGELPFRAGTSAEVMAMHLRTAPQPPRELWPEIPPALEALMLAMLAKAPAARPPMHEVECRLDALSGVPEHPRTIARQRWARGWRAPCRKRPTEVRTLAAAVSSRVAALPWAERAETPTPVTCR